MDVYERDWEQEGERGCEYFRDKEPYIYFSFVNFLVEKQYKNSSNNAKELWADPAFLLAFL